CWLDAGMKVAIIAFFVHLFAGGWVDMINVENVTQKFGSVTALEGLSFQIERGESIALVGSSGAGKTTLLRILSTYMAPTSGKTLIAGHDGVTDSLCVRRLVGYLPEKDAIYPEMRVMEYLMFRARLRGLYGRTRVKRLREMVGRCGLAGLERALIGNLSKGETRRVLLADSLAGEPEVVLLDEPTLGLDPMNVDRIHALLAPLTGERTMIFSTHDMAEAEQLGSRIMILNKGKLAAFASPAELYSRYGVRTLAEVVKAASLGGCH
ncbi:MAG: ABC transporter ATP-binding protein, partial [bacterium]